jgi:hypothetical protein
MYTLDGRIRFALALQPADEANFNEKKLLEIVLSRRADGIFELSFLFSNEQEPATAEPVVAASAEIPEYVMVEEAV